MRLRRLLMVAMVLAAATGPGEAASGPQPGDVYREFGQVMLDNTWRVVDPNTPQEAARVDLPNPVHPISVTDLTGAVRAELVIDFWGGHYRTSQKRVRLNGQAWLPVPELATTPGRQLPSSFMQQWNPVIEVPLSHLHLGDNSLEGICGDQIDGFHWGQWGWYGAILRIYYAPSKPHPTGRVTSPTKAAVLGENPRVQVAAESPRGIQRVDVLGYYEGCDENGDGRYRDWHHYYHYTSLRGHIGTVTSAPYEVTWDTRWVPDQPGGVELLARLQDGDGVWYVTDPVRELSLRRVGSTVKLYPATGVPPLFSVRDDRAASCTVRLPREVDLGHVLEAGLYLRTWNGWEENFAVNGWSDAIGGASHNYAADVRPVPRQALRTGRNTVSFHSTTVHHGVEVLWPGPTLVVRYALPAPALPQPYYLPLSVNAAGCVRDDAPVEMPVDFPALLKALEVQGAVDAASLHLVEVNDRGEVVDGAVGVQWDRAAPEAGVTSESLVFLLEGTTAADATRHFRLYFDLAGARVYPPSFAAARVQVTQGIMRAEQESLRLQTTTATYYYHLQGAGFASLEDEQGNDWISYRPGGGAAGEYRGIPNLVYPEGYFHPGKTSSHSRLLSSGPLRARIFSETEDGKWAVRWDVYPAWATLTVLRVDHPYWFLYEGTPAGLLDTARDYWARSDGQSGEASQTWSAPLAGPGWTSFAKPLVAPRVLCLTQHEEHGAPTSYYPLQEAMTVFGFGRRDDGPPQSFLTATPARFSVLLAPAEFPDMSRSVAAVLSAPRVVVGAPKGADW
jgi:hypothetical protein